MMRVLLVPRCNALCAAMQLALMYQESTRFIPDSAIDGLSDSFVYGSSWIDRFKADVHYVAASREHFAIRNLADDLEREGP